MRVCRLLKWLACLAAFLHLAACASDSYAPAKSRRCPECKRETFRLSGFAPPEKGVIVYDNGTVKVFDLGQRTLSYIVTDPLLSKAAPARVVSRLDAQLTDDEYDRVLTTANAAWAPVLTKKTRGCQGIDDSRLSQVALFDGRHVYWAYACSGSDRTGELRDLTSMAEDMSRAHKLIPSPGT